MPSFKVGFLLIISYL